MRSLTIASMFIRVVFFAGLLLLASVLFESLSIVLKGAPDFNQLTIYKGTLASYNENCGTKGKGMPIKVSTNIEYIFLYLPCSKKLKSNIKGALGNEIEVGTYTRLFTSEIWHIVLNENIIYNYEDLKISRREFTPLFIEILLIIILVIVICITVYILIYYDKLVAKNIRDSVRKRRIKNE